jgi:hypothetical protein
MPLLGYSGLDENISRLTSNEEAYHLLDSATHSHTSCGASISDFAIVA